MLGDWDHPYLTMDPKFEAEEVKVFGKMYEKGYIYKGLKPVYWCPSDETALAEAEIEYQDDPCTTVYVKFPMHDDLGKLSARRPQQALFPHLDNDDLDAARATSASACIRDESYALVKADNGEIYIVAEALAEKVMRVGGIEKYEILETHPGSFFENMLADHPFLPKTSRLLNAEYVTMDSGTGCVHTAPGFGADDYQTCRRYGMNMIVPVDDQGRHTDYAGKYAGMKTEESNPVILEDMRESGMLFASEDIVHSYPHCWRCHKPIIFRATPQWFCSVDTFKDDAVRRRGQGHLASRLGPRPHALHDPRARRLVHLPPAPLGSAHPGVLLRRLRQARVHRRRPSKRSPSLFGEHGSNIWFDAEAKELLPDGFTCPHCGGSTGFTKETDTLDGWFDSGSHPHRLHAARRPRLYGRRTCILRAAISTAAGSSHRC